MHKPIQIKDLALSFSHKTCFEPFSGQINAGDRIAIIGRNGSGKSSLLNMLAGSLQPSSGTITFGSGVVVGYVPQILAGEQACSGGQRFNAALSRALSDDPTVLLLDEPTNHLDQRNRRSLLRMLQQYRGTLVMVSHDEELLEQSIETLWHIEHAKIHCFDGRYRDYLANLQQQRASMQREIMQLTKQKKQMHVKQMQEQQRAASSRSKGEKSIDQRKWPSIVSKSKALRAQETAGRKQTAIEQRKAALTDAIENLYVAEEIVPTFSLESSAIRHQPVVQIVDGSVGYTDTPLLTKINLLVMGTTRLAITGDNGCGKSTLIRAMLRDPNITRAGEWLVIKDAEIGYLDQHYATLDPAKTVLDTIATQVPEWSESAVRQHLNRFLFRTNAVVAAKVATLSGGERARLSLAQLAAKTPRVLILDEITNNLDLETKQHVMQVLRAYPGALIVISHDPHFLAALELTDCIDVQAFSTNLARALTDADGTSTSV